MSKRFSVTVPDAIGQVIEKIAEAEGAKPASTASFIVERAIKDELRSGNIPSEWAVLESTQDTSKDVDAGSSPAELDQADYDVLVNLVSQLAEGAEPSPTAIAQAARVARVSPHALHAALEKRKNGNGEHVNK